MEGGADWKADIFSEIGEIWAKTGVPGLTLLLSEPCRN